MDQMTLARVRESKGVKKGAVAEAINVTYPTYKKYEENTRNMPAGALADACKFLGVSLDSIFLEPDCN